MSSVPLTRTLRQPLRMWRWPHNDILTEKVFKRGIPPFDPFPSIQDVVDATLCPVTIVHNIYHGIGGALVGSKETRETSGERFGKYYHEFLATLKNEILNGRARPQDALSLLSRFCSMKGIESTIENNLRRLLNYWLRERKDHLEALWNQKTGLYFEIQISSINVTFGQRRTRYPIYGIIDEIDTLNKRIVERTSKGKENDNIPPLLKDFQVWLLWKVLASIDENLIPNIWRNENFEEYQLVVETPYRDFLIAKDNPTFERWAEDALAWISDITRSYIAVEDAWRNKGHHTRLCTYGNEIEECALARVACFYRRRRYPERRGALRAALRPFYRALYNEQLWTHDLLLYQLTMMEQDNDPILRDTLRKLLIGRNIYPIEIRSELGNGQFMIKVDRQINESILETLQEENMNFDILFGSFSIGLRRRMFLLRDDERSNPEEGTYIAQIERPAQVEGMQAFLVRGLLIKEDPWFLKRGIQRALFSLERWGIDDGNRARNHISVRLIDTLFGAGRLRARVWEIDEDC